jgi:hypothetical protein
MSLENEPAKATLAMIILVGKSGRAYRGDSGSSRINPNRRRAGTIWKAIGNLQATELGSKKEQPKSSQ